MPTQAANKEIVRETVIQTLQSLGIDVSDPENVIHFQRDMHYLRDLRLQGKEIKNTTIRRGVDVIVNGMAAALLIALMQTIGIFKV